MLMRVLCVRCDRHGSAVSFPECLSTRLTCFARECRVGVCETVRGYPRYGELVELGDEHDEEGRSGRF